MKEITFVAYLPPPIGGITNFNNRFLLKLLENDVTLAQVPIYHASLISDVLSFIRKNKLKSGKIFISTATSYKLFLAFFILKLFSLDRLVIMLHNFDLGANRMSVFKKGGVFASLLRFFLSRLDAVIVVNEEMKQRLEEFSLTNVIVAPAYIKTESKEELPAEVAEYITKYDTIFCSNGWIKLIPEGELYGILEIVNSAYSLPDKSCIVIYIINVDKQGPEEKVYYEKVKAIAAGIPQVMLFESTVSFEPLLRKSHVFIRNTLSDGDALSIREAMDTELKVLATDVVKRPRGVLTYAPGQLVEAINGINGHVFAYSDKIDSYNIISNVII